MQALLAGIFWACVSLACAGKIAAAQKSEASPIYSSAPLIINTNSYSVLLISKYNKCKRWLVWSSDGFIKLRKRKKNRAEFAMQFCALCYALAYFFWLAGCIFFFSSSRNKLAMK
nr:hypothetical protein [Ophiocordyceps sp.]